MAPSVQPLRTAALLGAVLSLAIAPHADAAPLGTATLAIQFEGWPELVTIVPDGAATGTAVSSTLIYLDAAGFYAAGGQFTQPDPPLAQGFPRCLHAHCDHLHPRW